MRKLLALAVFFPLCLFGQLPVSNANPCLQQGCYFATVTGTIASSGTSVLTIQQPATGGRQVTLIAAVVQCAGQAFTVDQAQNGTAATTTAGTIVKLIPTTATAAAKIFTASNVGGGTAVAPTLTYTSGDPRVIDLSQRTTGLSGTANNYTITVTNSGAASCTGGIGLYWSEKI